MTVRQPRRQGRSRSRPSSCPAAPAEVLERRWLVFGIVSIGLFMASIDQTIVATALPAIEHDLHAGINWSGWTITIYALGQVIAMPMAGKISDMYGRKKVFAVSAAVFTLASLCCGFAPNMALLLVPRFIQALGGGAFMPSATGIVVRPFRPRARPRRRHVHLHPASRRHHRAHRRRRLRQLLVLARHLPGQRADRHRS